MVDRAWLPLLKFTAGIPAADDDPRNGG